MMVKDEWVRAAIRDDSVVVELLMGLKQRRRASMTTSVAKSAMVAAAALRWGIRQPRSRSLRCDGVKGDSTTNSMRASPRTPLSWSGGGGGDAASPSTTVDAFEEISRHQSFGTRSKGTGTNEFTSNPTKRSRRKKTFAELKEEESLLLKERIHLNKEIETLRATFKEESAKNDNLKRMKLDLRLHSAFKPGKAGSTLVHKRIVSLHDQLPSIGLPSSESNEIQKAIPQHNSVSILPDLNMMPSEDDSDSETLYGMS